MAGDRKQNQGGRQGNLNEEDQLTSPGRQGQDEITRQGTGQRDTQTQRTGTQTETGRTGTETETQRTGGSQQGGRTGQGSSNG